MTFLKIYCDGGARGNPGPAAAAFVAEEDGKVIYKGTKFLGTTTNNVAEYSAVILALVWLLKNSSIQHPASGIQIILDSELVAKQLSGKFKIKNSNLKKLFEDAKSLEKKIQVKITFSTVERSKNKLADFLVNKTLDIGSST